MVVGFTTTYAISVYHPWWCEFESRSWRGVQYYVFFDLTMANKNINLIMVIQLVDNVFVQYVKSTLHDKTQHVCITPADKNWVDNGFNGVQYYVIKFVSDLRQIDRWFSPGPPVSSTNKTYSHDITEILFKVALNTIKQTNKNYLQLQLSVQINIDTTTIRSRPQWPLIVNRQFCLIQFNKNKSRDLI
jgi:hypothetical protein